MLRLQHASAAELARGRAERRDHPTAVPTSTSTDKHAPSTAQTFANAWFPSASFREHRTPEAAPLQAAAMTFAGVRPILLDNVGWWKVNGFGPTPPAFVTYVRAAADHAGVVAAEICQRISAKYDIASPKL